MMNYFKQGDVANADKIKAAFKAKGIDVLGFRFADKTVVYCSIGGACVQTLPYSVNLMNILYSHPDYQELELGVKPKFKVGDWVVKKDGETLYGGNYAEQITLIDVDEIWFSSKTWTFEDDIRPWTIADAKDGDMLATDNGWTCIFKAFDGCVFSSYCFMDSQKWVCEVGAEGHTLDSSINGNIHPATKEQRTLFFKKLQEAGYEWDEKKKELRKTKPHYDITNFKPFDKVLCRNCNNDIWRADYFSHLPKNGKCYVCIGYTWCQCIPYNDDTKHLLGTTDMCPEEYINW